MADPSLVLRDIHQPPAPPWWPPAPGWWLLAAVLLLAIAAWAWWAARKRKQRRAIAAVFDNTVAAADTPAAQVAAMSELLRRAARRVDPNADRLQGEAWLEFLDRGGPHARRKGTSNALDRHPREGGDPERRHRPDEALDPRLRGDDGQRQEQTQAIDDKRSSRSSTNGFADGPGRLLLQGGYQREVDPVQVEALRPLARARFLQWMGVRGKGPQRKAKR